MEKLEALLKYIVSEMVKTQDAIDITYEEKKDLIVFKKNIHSIVL